eukprot:2378883-Amphidinium_carterae.1
MRPLLLHSSDLCSDLHGKTKQFLPCCCLIWSPYSSAHNAAMDSRASVMTLACQFRNDCGSQFSQY